jgi:hypothetical protein
MYTEDTGKLKITAFLLSFMFASVFGQCQPAEAFVGSEGYHVIITTSSLIKRMIKKHERKVCNYKAGRP